MKILFLFLFFEALPSQNIDTEIARSLLDLSKKAEQGGSTSRDLSVTEGQRGIEIPQALAGWQNGLNNCLLNLNSLVLYSNRILTVSSN